MRLNELSDYCDNLLKANDFKDYCPNGLQVESGIEVSHIVAGVTGSLALIDAAIDVGADAILVHHGYFWKGEDQTITRQKGQRISRLIRHGISLLAYHLPLDAHPELGNNAQLAKLMGWSCNGSFGDVGGHDIAFTGKLSKPQTLIQFESEISTKLSRKALAISGGDHPVNNIAWCTGAAQGYLEEALKNGADTFVSGEISENTVHFAREAGIHYVAAGHHATERYGVQALASHLESKFDIQQQFIDIDNPV